MTSCLISDLRRIGAYTRKLASLAGLTVVIGLGSAPGITVYTRPAYAKNEELRKDIGKYITVRIEGATQGSGVLINRVKNKYTVLTAWHVISPNNPGEEVSVIAPDGKIYQTQVQGFRKIGETDLGTLEIETSNNYSVADMSIRRRLRFGESVTVIGYPNKSNGLVTSQGRVRGDFDVGEKNGYQTYYNAKTAPGMSGGAVINTEGLLVAIHGRGERNETFIEKDAAAPKTGVNKGIPITLYKSLTIGEKMTEEEPAKTPMYLFTIGLNNLSGRDRAAGELPYQTALDFIERGLVLANREENKKLKDIYLYFGKYFKGQALTALGDYRASATSYERAIEIYESGGLTDDDAIYLAEAYGGAGYSYKKIGELSKARLNYKRALELDPNNPALLTNNANILTLEDKPLQAISIYKKALELARSSSIRDQTIEALILANLGIQNDNIGASEIALSFYDEAIKLGPTPEMFAKRGVALSRLGRKHEALLDLGRAVGLEPTLWTAWHDFGIVLEHLKRYAEARDAYSNVIESNAPSKERARAYSLVATTYELEARWTQAIATRKKALELLPSDRGERSRLEANKESLVASRYCDTRQLQDATNLRTYAAMEKVLSSYVAMNPIPNLRLFRVSTEMLNLCPSLREQSRLRFYRGLSLFAKIPDGINTEDSQQAVKDLEFVTRHDEEIQNISHSYYAIAAIHLAKGNQAGFCSAFGKGAATGVYRDRDLISFLRPHYKAKCAR